MKSKKLLVMAGGTGGHVFPALAVANLLKEQGWQIRWLGTADRMEADLVPKAGIAIDFIKISGVRGKGLFNLLKAPYRVLKAICQAKKVIKHYQPDVVLGMGGYVSGPGGIAAWLLRVPIVLHEQNGVAGLTNRLLSKVATRVLQAFPGAIAQAQVVGNPVRKDLLTLLPPASRYAVHQGPLRILVIGGSQGARILNETIPPVIAQLGSEVTVLHQVGKGAGNIVSLAYQKLGCHAYEVVEFIDDMAHVYSWADVVICRSGALTVSEIASIGIAAIFIPFMHKDRQQYWNAAPLEKIGAAVIIEQPNLSVEKLVNILSQWDRQSLLTMAEKAKVVAIDDAAERVAEVIKQCTTC